MNVKQKIDNTLNEARKQGLTIVAIKLDLETYKKFVQEILEECPYISVSLKYQDIKVISGYGAIIEQKPVENGLICVYMFNDYGLYYIKDTFIPLKSD